MITIIFSNLSEETTALQVYETKDGFVRDQYGNFVNEDLTEDGPRLKVDLNGLLWALDRAAERLLKRKKEIGLTQRRAMGVVKDDFFRFLSQCPSAAVEVLRDALVEGKIDGGTYEGECCCLVGTVQKVLDKKIRAHLTVEALAGLIKKGDTPETNFVSGVFVDWIDEYME